MSESAVVKACIQWLYLNGCDVTRCNSGSVLKQYTTKAGVKRTYRIQFGKKGMGDIVGCTAHGRYYEVECKTATGKQREEQIERQKEVEGKNGIYILARSIDDLELRKGELKGYWPVS